MASYFRSTPSPTPPHPPQKKEEWNGISPKYAGVISDGCQDILVLLCQDYVLLTSMYYSLSQLSQCLKAVGPEASVFERLKRVLSPGVRLCRVLCAKLQTGWGCWEEQNVLWQRGGVQSSHKQPEVWHVLRSEGERTRGGLGERC